MQNHIVFTFILYQFRFFIFLCPGPGLGSKAAPRAPPGPGLPLLWGPGLGPGPKHVKTYVEMDFVLLADYFHISHHMYFIVFSFCRKVIEHEPVNTSCLLESISYSLLVSYSWVIYGSWSLLEATLDGFDRILGQLCSHCVFDGYSERLKGHFFCASVHFGCLRISLALF